MKQIIDNRLYDTEKSEKIYEYIKRVEYSRLIFNDKPLYQNRKASIFKTANGNYFLYIEKRIDDKISYCFNPYIEEITELEVKRIISEIDADKYIELFGMEDLEVQ